MQRREKNKVEKTKRHKVEKTNGQSPNLKVKVLFADLQLYAHAEAKGKTF